MLRNTLRSHILSGSVALTALLIASGAAWGQSGATAGSATGAAAATAGESVDTGSTSASAATGSFDATLSTNPLGLSPQSTGPQRSSSRRQSESTEDSAVEGFLRNDSGLRSAPSFSSNAGTSTSTGTSDFSPRGRSLGVTASSGELASPVASGNSKAFGVNAISSEPGGSNGIGNGSDNGRALGVNASANFFSAHVRSKGTTELEDHGKGKAHGRNSNSNDLSADEGGNGKGKKLGHARFDETVIAQVPSNNPVISDAVALPSNAAAVVPAALQAVAVIPSVAAAAVSDLSAPGLQAAPSPVPEPANWLLLALGLLVLAARALKRRGIR